MVSKHAELPEAVYRVVPILRLCESEGRSKERVTASEKIAVPFDTAHLHHVGPFVRSSY